MNTKTKRTTRALSLILTVLMLFALIPAVSVSAAFNRSSDITYGYSTGVTVGKIRYIAQQNSSGTTFSNYFYSDYWYNGNARYGCFVASTSMALSYMGVNMTPKTMRSNGLISGTNMMSSSSKVASTASSYSGLSISSVYSGSYITNFNTLDTAISNFQNGNGIYSPPIVWTQGADGGTHYFLVTKKISANMYEMVDPISEINKKVNLVSYSTNIVYGNGGTAKGKLSDVVQYKRAGSIPTTSPFTYTVSNGETTITGYTGSGGAVSVPSTLGGYPVTTIGDSAFLSKSSITSVTLPSTIKTIKHKAFTFCVNMTSINFPYGLTTIESHAFRSCEKLASVEFPNSLVTIDHDAFFACYSLSSVYIPSSVTLIGVNAFQGSYEALTSVTVDPQNRNYSSVDGVLFDKSGTTIYLFPPKKPGSSYTVPSGVRTIGANAFYLCGDLVTVTLPDGVNSIDANAFRGCGAMTRINIPASVTSIAADAFSACNVVVIYAPVGSYAISFAITNGIAYVATQQQHTHSFGAWRVTTAATCTAAGVQTRYCTSCPETETLPISATGHSWGAWSVVTPATATAEGSETRTCAVCSATENRAIPIASPFYDVPAGAWYYEAVLWCNNRGFMNGTGEGVFSPGENVTRATIVMILAKLSNADLTKFTTTSFGDVPTGRWYSAAVQWAVSSGITEGVGGNLFAPNMPLSREQLATFFLAYARYKGYDVSRTTDLGRYTDASSVSAWANGAMRWAIASGLISGTSASTLSPKSIATRAQIAVIIKQFYENVANGAV